MKPDDSLELPLLRGEGLAGRALTRVVVSTAVLTVLVAVVAAALARLGSWEPLVAVIVLMVLAALSWRVSAVVPSRALPLWSALALLLISLGAVGWAGLTRAEQILPRSEAGVNAQAAVLLAQQHEWPMPVSANEIGGSEALLTPGVTIAGLGVRELGSASEPSVEPLALIGGPAWLTVGFWVGGVAGMLWVPALFGGMAVLAVGLLTSSVVGPRWGPIGALAAALCFPWLHAARETSPDVMVVFVLIAGLLLLVAATRAGARGSWQQARTVGFLAGALVAGGCLYRLEALGPTVALLPVAALLMIRRDGAGAPLVWGAGIVTGLAGLSAAGLSGGLLEDQHSALVRLVLFGLGVALLALLMVVLGRRGVRVPDRIRVALPASAAALAPLGALALVALPSSQALAWTSWWTGPWSLAITVIIVAAAAHHLARTCLESERLPGWTGALAVGLAAATLRWLSPWGDRTTPWVGAGLVVALPLVIVCAAGATAWVTRWSTRHLPTAAAVVASFATAAAVLVPTALATAPLADERVSLGEVSAVQQVCRAFGPADVVLMVDDRAADEWPTTVRARCDVPALSLTPATRRDQGARASAVSSVAHFVAARGGRLVVMAAGSAWAVASLASDASGTRVPVTVGAPVTVVSGSVTQDPLHVDDRPEGLSSFPLQVWLSAVG